MFVASTLIRFTLACGFVWAVAHLLNGPAWLGMAVLWLRAEIAHSLFVRRLFVAMQQMHAAGRAP
jgi:hypothetical protein